MLEPELLAFGEFGMGVVCSGVAADGWPRHFRHGVCPPGLMIRRVQLAQPRAALAGCGLLGAYFRERTVFGDSGILRGFFGDSSGILRGFFEVFAF